MIRSARIWIAQHVVVPKGVVVIDTREWKIRLSLRIPPPEPFKSLQEMLDYAQEHNQDTE